MTKVSFYAAFGLVFLLYETIPGFEPLAMRFAAACLLVALLAVSLVRFQEVLGIRDLVGGSVVLASVAGTLLLDASWGPVLSIAVGLSGLALVARDALPRCRYRALAQGALLLGTLMVLFERVPTVSFALDEASYWLSARVCGLMGGGPLGASAGGLTGLLGMLCLAAGGGVWRARGLRLRVAGLLGALYGAQLIAQGFVSPEPMGVWVRLIYLAIAAAVVVWWVETVLRRDAPAAPTTQRAVSVVMAVGCFVLGFFVSMAPNLGAGQGDVTGAPRVLFVEQEMLGTWNTPADVPPGEGLVGANFGLLPSYLEAYGYLTTVSTDLPADLEGVDAVVLINPGKPFSEAEQELLLGHVQAGGGLLVLGDHTNMVGLMDHTNELLEPVGMWLEFDSAIHVQRGWGRDQVVTYPFNLAYDGMDVQVGIGASLGMRWSPSRVPLLTGRRAFSDAGDPENEAKGFLGNMRLDRAEKYGDLVLAAAAHWRGGRVVLYGDTSPFQNSVLPASHGYIASLVAWLVAGGGAWAVWAGLFAGVSLAGGVLWFGFSTRVHPGYILCTSLALLAGLTLGGMYALWRLPQPEIAGERVAFVDVGHGNVLSLLPLVDNALDGLTTALQREGWLPVLTTASFDELRAGPARLWISVAPTDGFCEAEAQAIREFAEEGGTFILGTDWSYVARLRGFLQPLGVWLDNRPLTSLSLSGGAFRAQEQMPFLQLAWALQLSPDWSVLAALETDGLVWPVVARLPQGRGWLVVVGSSKFFLNPSLEGRRAHHPGNLALLSHLLQLGEKED